MVTTVELASVLGLAYCDFSDVDPFDPTVCPFGAAVGDDVGFYYRGAAVSGIAVYAGAAATKITQFPSRVIRVVPLVEIQSRLTACRCRLTAGGAGDAWHLDHTRDHRPRSARSHHL